MKSAAAAAEYIQTIFSDTIDLAIVQGSGITITDDEFIEKASISYTDIPGFPPPTVEGHGGILTIASYAGKNIAFFKGRIHFYEGYTMWDVAFPIRMMHKLGIKEIVLTNAAGSVNKEIQPGDLVLLNDYINLVQANPLIGNPPDDGPRFIDMSNPFALKMKQSAKRVLGDMGVERKEGTYVFLTGPTYETPSEVRMTALLGGDLVGMSTVPEVIMARQLEMNVLGISLCTNYGTGISDEPLSHTEVIEIGKKTETTLRKFFKGFIDVL